MGILYTGGHSMTSRVDDILDTIRQGVKVIEDQPGQTKRRGRRRVYASNADKQRAYRQRVKARQ